MNASKPAHGGYPNTRGDEVIRLGCLMCDRDDYDGITEQELAILKHSWQDIAEFHGVHVMDWETHMGTCPECMSLLQ